MSALIMLRGNSGSGKTTIARKVQHELGRGTMLIPHDVVRREILWVKDQPDNASIQLTYDLAMHGKSIGFTVVLEGILPTSVYGDMIVDLTKAFAGQMLAYYFDLPFEETLKRHQTKANSHEFGEAEMREWWREKDLVGQANEKLITQSQTESEILALIMADHRDLVS